jgi:hypothetical protein
LAQEEGIGLAAVHKVVRKQFKLFPYKVTAVQNLKLADMKNEYITVNGLQILFKGKLLIFLMSPSPMRHGSTSQVMLTHNFGRRRILMLCMKCQCMTRKLECGLQYPDSMNKIKRVQACINTRGHHFQHLL